jgi:hypothetical protein
MGGGGGGGGGGEREREKKRARVPPHTRSTLNSSLTPEMCVRLLFL